VENNVRHTLYVRLERVPLLPHSRQSRSNHIVEGQTYITTCPENGILGNLPGPVFGLEGNIPKTRLCRRFKLNILPCALNSTHPRSCGRTTPMQRFNFPKEYASKTDEELLHLAQVSDQLTVPHTNRCGQFHKPVGNQCELNGSMQHWLGVYQRAFQSLKFFGALIQL
jgi:hypothetical protein